jgi:hypothetical protein
MIKNTQKKNLEYYNTEMNKCYQFNMKTETLIIYHYMLITER